ncbi:Hypothetical protein SRAE_2000418000 [Strongyloides ratti]|uniref:Serpentine receptor class gamma n=1 Tax=Strongyloides ratti TaxID=34506 RepID=A0A090LIF6_STRRB|nr:Hypothetical protein SRAE_2000418000 [Strongyloides ratti]CEF69532.1 Hypothetical protein SRAE_2000418000 [Strongyloides ratti]
MGIIRYHRHKIIDTAIIAITISLIFTFLGYFGFRCIYCLYLARKSNAHFLYYLRIFVYICSITTTFYSISYLLFIFEKGFKVTEQGIIGSFYANINVYFSRQILAPTFIYPLVTLGPFIVSIPPVLKVYRRIKLNDDKFLSSVYNVM